MQLKPGEIIDSRYRIDTILGAGGMGIVYRAYDTQLERIVAVKVLNVLSSDSTLLSRFEREATCLAQLDHPKVIKIYRYGLLDGGIPYLCTEYIDGEPLSRICQQKGCLPWQRVIGIGHQISEGLAYAHKHGVVHRDIKPQNILITADATGNGAKIIDFGLCYRPDTQRLTQDGQLVGTVYYIAPELVCGQAAPDERSDIYSLGCVLYELLCGSPPITADNAVALMVKHRDYMPTPPSATIPEGIPSDLDDLIMTMLQKNPDDRPQSMDEVTDRLTRLDPNRISRPSGSLPRVQLQISTGSARRWAAYTLSTIMVMITGFLIALAVAPEALIAFLPSPPDLRTAELYLQGAQNLRRFGREPAANSLLQRITGSPNASRTTLVTTLTNSTLLAEKAPLLEGETLAGAVLSHIDKLATQDIVHPSSDAKQVFPILLPLVPRCIKILSSRDSHSDARLINDTLGKSSDIAKKYELSDVEATLMLAKLDWQRKSIGAAIPVSVRNALYFGAALLNDKKSCGLMLLDGAMQHYDLEKTDAHSMQTDTTFFECAFIAGAYCLSKNDTVRARRYSERLLAKLSAYPNGCPTNPELVLKSADFCTNLAGRSSDQAMLTRTSAVLQKLLACHNMPKHLQELELDFCRTESELSRATQKQLSDGAGLVCQHCLERKIGLPNSVSSEHHVRSQVLSIIAYASVAADQGDQRMLRIAERALERSLSTKDNYVIDRRRSDLASHLREVESAITKGTRTIAR